MAFTSLFYLLVDFPDTQLRLTVGPLAFVLDIYLSTDMLPPYVFTVGLQALLEISLSTGARTTQSFIYDASLRLQPAATGVSYLFGGLEIGGRDWVYDDYAWRLGWITRRSWTSFRANACTKLWCMFLRPCLVEIAIYQYVSSCSLSFAADIPIDNI